MAMAMSVLHPKEYEASPRLHKSCERRRSDHFSHDEAVISRKLTTNADLVV